MRPQQTPDVIQAGCLSMEVFHKRANQRYLCPASPPARACYSNKSALCGAVAFPNLDQAPRPSGPGPYRGQM